MAWCAVGYAVVASIPARSLSECVWAPVDTELVGVAQTPFGARCEAYWARGACSLGASARGPSACGKYPVDLRGYGLALGGGASR